MNLDAQCEGGAINITHVMAFQEVIDRTEYISNKVNVTKSKWLAIAAEAHEKQLKVNVKKTPNSIINCATNNKKYTVLSSQFRKTYFIWLILT